MNEILNVTVNTVFMMSHFYLDDARISIFMYSYHTQYNNRLVIYIMLFSFHPG